MATKLGTPVDGRSPSPLRGEGLGEVHPANRIARSSLVAPARLPIASPRRRKPTERGTFNPELLLEQFDTLADTPEAVGKLRKLILDFAIRGRLVPQNSKDEPAIRLVERAKAVLEKNKRRAE